MNAPAPGSPEWQKLMTASKVAAVLGLSPWESPRSLWLKMRGDLPADPGNDATRRGQYLEDGILNWWSDRHPDIVYPTPQAFLMREDWAASTPDLVVEDDGFGNRAVVDAKTAARDDDWGQPGTDEIPPYYLAQMLWQMWTHDAQVGYVAVLFGTRLRFEEYVVQRDDELIAGIVAKCRAFYDSLSQDVPPPLDDHVADYAATVKTVTGINAQEAVELADNVAADYLQALAYKDAAPIFAARVLDAMGEAQYATHNGQRIARRQKKGDGVSLVRIAALPNVTNTIPEEEDAA